MKRSVPTLVASGIIIGSLLNACSKETSETQQAIENLKSISESAGQAQDASNLAAKRQEERKAKGDTLPFTGPQLAAMTISTVSGYTLESGDTTSTSTIGFNLTTVKHHFTNPAGGYVDVEIADYNSSAMMYSGLTAMFNMKIRTESNGKSEGTFQTDNPLVAGSDSYDKQSKDAMVQYGLGGRFYLQLRSNTMNVDQLKALASSLDLNKLAAL